MSIPSMDDYKFERQGDSTVDLSGREDYEVSRCPGYNFDQLGECGESKDEDERFCDDCQSAAELDAREAAERAAWREGEPVEPLPYPHLIDRD